MLAWLVAYQVALAQAAPQPVPDADFDLREVDPDAAAGTIVVTGRRRSSQRLEVLPDLSEPPLPRIETRLFGNARLGTDVEAGAGGMPRAMVTLKIPF